MKFFCRTFEIVVVQNEVPALRLVEKEAVEERLIAFDVRREVRVESWLLLFHWLKLELVWKDELNVLLLLSWIVKHREEDLWVKVRLENIFISLNLLHELLLRYSSNHEVFNELVRNLLARGCVLHLIITKIWINCEYK